MQTTSLEFDPLRARLDEPLVMIGGTAVTLASIVSFVVFLAVAFGVSWLVRRSLRRVFRARGIDEGVSYAVARLLHYAIVAVGGFLALDNLGVSVTALAGLGAILAVGIGFGLQNIAQNFVSGIILLLERPVKKGDFVVVGETRGTVRQIRARSTVITTLDNVDIIVPNGDFVTEQVTNETYIDCRMRVRVEVGVAYGSDTELVRATLQRVAEANERVLRQPAPVVLFTDFGDWSLECAAGVGGGPADSPRGGERAAFRDRTRGRLLCCSLHNDIATSARPLPLRIVGVSVGGADGLGPFQIPHASITLQA